MRFAFLGILLTIALPLSVLSVLSDMNRGKLIAAALLAGAGVVFYGFTTTASYHAIQEWLALSRYFYATAFGIGAAMLALAGVGSVFLRRRALLQLDWPRSTSQMEMQKLGVTFLCRHGWQLESVYGFAGISVYRGRKDVMRMFVLFLRHPLAVDRLLRNLTLVPGIVLRNVVIVTHDRPSQGLHDALAPDGVSIMFYRELDDVDALCIEVERRRLAARVSQTNRQSGRAAASGVRTA